MLMKETRCVSIKWVEVLGAMKEVQTLLIVFSSYHELSYPLLKESGNYNLLLG